MKEAMLYQAGSAADGNTTIPLYDWDGVTLLASAIVPKGASPAEAWAAIHGATAELMGPEARGAYLAGTYDQDTSYYDPDYPLTGKRSYSFGKWLDCGDSAWTSYGPAVEILNVNSVLEIPEPVGSSESVVPWGGLKAAYKGVAAELNLLTTASQRAYQLTLDRVEFRDNSTYEAYMTLRRGNVHRIRVAVMRVRDAGTGQVDLRRVENQDQVTISMILFKPTMESIEVLAVDDGSQDGHIAPTRSTVLKISRDGLDGYVVLGTVWDINLSLKNNQPKWITISDFTTVEIPLVAGDVYGTQAGDSKLTVRNAAQSNLLTAWKEKNGVTGSEWPADGDYADLTRAEMVTAVATGHYVAE